MAPRCERCSRINICSRSRSREDKTSPAFSTAPVGEFGLLRLLGSGGRGSRNDVSGPSRGTGHGAALLPVDAITDTEYAIGAGDAAKHIWMVVRAVVSIIEYLRLPESSRLTSASRTSAYTGLRPTMPAPQAARRSRFASRSASALGSSRAGRASSSRQAFPGQSDSGQSSVSLEAHESRWVRERRAQTDG